MKSYYLTDAGKVRSHNEDSVTIVKNGSEEYLLLVADGMGGHRAGEVASSLAVTHFGKRFSSLSSVGNLKDAVSWINDNVSEINEAILDYAKNHFDSTGLGTTLVLALLTKDFLILAFIPLPYTLDISLCIQAILLALDFTANSLVIGPSRKAISVSKPLFINDS